MYYFLGISPILSIIASIIFKESKIIILLMFDVYIKIYVHNKEKNTISAIGLAYLREFIHAAKKLSVIKNNRINPSTAKMKKLLNELKTIKLGIKRNNSCLIFYNYLHQQI